MNTGIAVSGHIMFSSPPFWLWQWMLSNESDKSQKIYLGKYLYKPTQGDIFLNEQSGVRDDFEIWPRSIRIYKNGG